MSLTAGKPWRRWLPPLVLGLVGCALLAALAHGLAPEGFFCGDQGVKLVAARAALAHPLRPFDLPLPTIGNEAAPDLLGSFCRAHGHHAHAITSPLFPVLTALPLGLFGLRGLYVLPAVAWLLTLWLAAEVARACGEDVALSTFLVAGATPLLFYALEFWEHLPAVALTTAATLIALHAERRPSLWLVVGAVTGIAFLLRPEALLYGVAVAIVACPWGRMLRLSLGVALSQAPLVAYNLAHFGNVVGGHLSSNIEAVPNAWGSTRVAIARVWFLDGAAWPLILSAVGLVTVWSARSERRALARRVGICLVFAAALWLTAVAIRRDLPREGLWAAFPLAALSLVPLGPAEGVADRPARLRRISILFIVLAWLTAPNDGGAQWSPRYLLPACVPLALVVAHVLRQWVRARRFQWLFVAGVASLACGSLWIQRSSYRDLRIAKRINARTVAAVAKQAGSARVVLSDLDWLDQIAAPLSPEMTFLFAASRDVARSAARRLQAAKVSSVLVVSARGCEGAVADWLAGTCYRPAPPTFLDDGAVVLVQESCRE